VIADCDVATKARAVDTDAGYLLKPRRGCRRSHCRGLGI